MELIYLQYDIAEIGKSFIIEENHYSIWTYIYDHHSKQVEIAGFVCSTTPPLESYEEAIKYVDKSTPPPLAKPYANSSSVIKEVKAEDFQVESYSDRQFIIKVKDVPITKLDLQTRKSYSKSLSQDGPYGLAWKD